MKKKKVEKEATATKTVQIVATIHEPNTMFLRMDVGTAKAPDGAEFELSTAVGGGTPIVRLPDKRWITFAWPALVDAAIEAGK